MPQSLLSLLHLADPALPIGGFSHSAGLETYVQKGIVNNKETAEVFIRNQLSQNIHYTDAAFVSLAYAACMEEDFDRLVTLEGLCSAVKLPREIREASRKLGMRLMLVFEPLCVSEMGTRYHLAIKCKELDGHYCIAFGICAAALSIAKEEMLSGFYYNAAASMVTNAVKLVPLGQLDGQQILFAVLPLIEQLAAENLEPKEALLGRCCPAFDLRCMQHEQLYSRLYMS